jgi:hypothetical protein
MGDTPGYRRGYTLASPLLLAGMEVSATTARRPCADCAVGIGWTGKAGFTMVQGSGKHFGKGTGAGCLADGSSREA